MGKKEELLARRSELLNQKKMSLLMQKHPYANDVPVGGEQLESMRAPAPYQRPRGNPASPSEIGSRAVTELSRGMSPIRAFGEGMTNTFGNVGQSISNPVEKMMGRQPGRYQEQNTTPNPSMLTSAMKGIGEGIPMMLVNPASMAGRVAGGAVGGALMNPESQLAGGAEGTLYSGLAEAIPGGAKGLSWASDKFTRSKYTKDMMDSISNNFNESTEKALSYLNPIMEKYGKEELTEEGFSNIVDSSREFEKYITGSLKKTYNKFLNNPTLENAQRYQSELANKSRRIKSKDATSINEVEALSDVRDSTLDAMNLGFNKMSPNAAEDFFDFRKTYAMEVAPYKNNKELKKIARMGSDAYGITPQSLEQSLFKSFENEVTPVHGNHALRQQANQLQGKNQRTEAYQNLSLGPLMGHFNYSPAKSIIQNPQIEKGAAAALPYYQAGTRGAMGYQLSPGNDLFGMNEMISSILSGKEGSQ